MRVRTLVLIIIVALALPVAGVAVFSWLVLDPPFCGTPPTHREEGRQEAFVRAHLPDASDFKWTVMDCDDNGQAYLSFSTRLTRDAASDAFLRDPACKISKEVDASPGDATCRSDNTNVSIYLDDSKGGINTHGELYPDQR
jgi:hypothetical protein